MGSIRKRFLWVRSRSIGSHISWFPPLSKKKGLVPTTVRFQGARLRVNTITMQRGTSPSEYLALSAHLARACWSRDSLPDLAQIYRTVHKITILYCRTSSSCIGIGRECLSKTASCIYIKLSYQHHRQEYKIEFVVHLLAFSWPWW